MLFISICILKNEVADTEVESLSPSPRMGDESRTEIVLLCLSVPGRSTSDVSSVPRGRGRRPTDRFHGRGDGPRPLGGHSFYHPGS